MADGNHNYYCVYCRYFLFEDTAERLCGEVNVHNSRSHPADFASWKANEIVCSCNYSGPGTPLPQYTAPEESTEVLVITEEDRLMLARGGVRW